MKNFLAALKLRSFHPELKFIRLSQIHKKKEEKGKHGCKPVSILPAQYLKNILNILKEQIHENFAIFAMWFPTGTLDTKRFFR